jgi:hypothetical protein
MSFGRWHDKRGCTPKVEIGSAARYSVNDKTATGNPGWVSDDLETFPDDLSF